jgi:hypothetical protein
LVRYLAERDRNRIGDEVEAFLASQSSASRYWPADDEVRQEVGELLAYRRIGRGRLRMVLEAIEDHARGWKDGKEAPGQERVTRGTHAIEHIMPRKWQTHWPLPPAVSEAERDRLVHTLGNLTLLRSRINSKASNAAWTGPGSKVETLNSQDTVFLNRQLVKDSAGPWAEARIRARTTELIDVILTVWPVPAGHKSAFVPDRAVRRYKSVGLIDLIAAGVLSVGAQLYPRRKQYSGRVATVLADGSVEVDGVPYSRPTDAAHANHGEEDRRLLVFSR